MIKGWNRIFRLKEVIDLPKIVKNYSSALWSDQIRKLRANIQPGNLGK